MKELYERILTDLSLAITRGEQFNLPAVTLNSLRSARALVLVARNDNVQEFKEPAWPDTTADRGAWQEAERRLRMTDPAPSISDIATLAQKIKKERTR